MRVIVVIVALMVGAARPAAAQGSVDDLEPSYLIDGGAVPFLWAPLLGTLGIALWVEPRAEPLWFDPDEGGLPSRRSREVPGLAISAVAAAAGLAIVADADASRWFHLKGFAESMAMTSFVTVSAKRLFGRHRPDYQGDGSNDERQSFPSGHTSRAAAALTYLGLYLRGHAFDRWREPGTLPAWEIASYAGLTAIGVATAAERVVHHRHHVGDVVAGALVGIASSVVFYLWHERRFDGSF